MHLAICSDRPYSVSCTFACAAETEYSYSCRPLRSVAALRSVPIPLDIQIKATAKIPPHSKLPFNVLEITKPSCGYKDASFYDMTCNVVTSSQKDSPSMCGLIIIHATSTHGTSILTHGKARLNKPHKHPSHRRPTF